VELAVQIDYGRQFAGAEFNRWRQEYVANVQVRAKERKAKSAGDPSRSLLPALDDEWIEPWWRDTWTEYEDFDQHPPEETPHGYIRDIY
jgi:hypothetical protein